MTSILWNARNCAFQFASSLTRKYACDELPPLPHSCGLYRKMPVLYNTHLTWLSHTIHYMWSYYTKSSKRSNIYLSHCYSIAWDRLPVWSLCVTVCMCVCVCLSRCVHALTVAILNRFRRKLTQTSTTWNERTLSLGTKEPFRWGSKSNKGFPYFYPILPQIGTHIMHFQWETWNASLTSSMDQL